MIRNNSIKTLLATLCTAAVSLTAAVPAGAADVDFAGKRVEVIVPFGEGGGADSYGRYMARVLGPVLPGAPTLLIRNIPGGGSINGANWFEQNARTDGTNFAVASTATTTAFGLQPNDPRIKFNPGGWKAFIASPMGRIIYAHANTGLKSVADLKNFKGKLVMAVDGPTGGDMSSVYSLHLLGVDPKAVFGTDGGDAHLGFERGEITVESDVASAFLQLGKPLVDSGVAVPLFTFGYVKDGKIVRDPSFPDLPSFPEAYEIINGKPPSGPQYDAWVALFYMAVMNSKALVLPAKAPPDVVKAYNDAAAKLVSNPAFVEESARFIGAYPQLTGDAATESLRKATEITPEARAAIAKYLKEQFNFNL